MAVDIGASFKIAAGVTGQQALDKLNSSLQQTQGLAKTVGLGLAGLGAGFGLSVLKDKFDGVVESMVRVKEAAEKTGASGDNISKIYQAAKITGDSFDTIEAGIIKMDKALAGLDKNTRGASHALEAIGLNIADLRKMDPADAFRLIALQLAKFEDGAGKTAVAMDVFGKSGAQLLPFMRDYAEMGNLVSKTTKEQREQADEYRKGLNALKVTQNEVYKTIGAELIPVANEFVKSLVEVNKETGGVRGAAKELAKDGTLTDIFKEGARAAAAFLDIIVLVGKSIAQMVSSLKVVGNDIVTVAESAVKAPGALFRSGGVEELRNLWRDRNAFTDQQNAAMDQRWSGSLTPYTDALEKNFAKPKASAKESPKSSGLLGYQSKDDTATGPDPYGSELSGLGRDVAKNRWMSDHIAQYAERITSAKEAQVQFDIEDGKFGALTDAQKKKLIETAQAVDSYAEKLRQAKEGLAYDRETRMIEANTRALGESELQKKITLSLQELENKGIKEGSDLYQELAARRTEALKKQDMESKSFMTGMQEGIVGYLDSVSNLAKQTSDIVSKAFNGMADAIAEFAVGGQANFTNLANSIIKDMIRIMVQQQITGPLASAFGGMLGSGFGNISTAMQFGTNVGSQQTAMLAAQSFDGGGYTGSGARAGGVDGKGGFIAIMHPQESVTDHTKGGSAGGGVVVNLTVNADTGQTQGADSSKLSRLGSSISAAVREQLIKEKRPGGLLAA